MSLDGIGDAQQEFDFTAPLVLYQLQAIGDVGVSPNHKKNQLQLINNWNRCAAFLAENDQALRESLAASTEFEPGAGPPRVPLREWASMSMEEMSTTQPCRCLLLPQAFVQVRLC